jgi:hypothetical protein
MAQAAEAGPSDAAFYWNAVLLDALLRDDQKPKPQREQGGVTRASRAAAIVHAAIHDAVNGVDRRYTPYLIQDRAPAGASPDAAAAGAAHATLVGLYPSQRSEGANLDARLAEYLETLAAGTGRDQGTRFGTAVGHALLLARQNDGRNSQNGGDPPYLEKQTLGEWRRDPMAPPEDQIPPLMPGWGSIRPFILDYGAELRPVQYPLLTTGDYTAAFKEVRQRGRARDRSEETARIGDFWSYDDMLGTPIRLYNQHTREILTQRPRPAAPTALHTHARIFALVTLAMADAGIGCWEAKYAYNLWRPVHGIQLAGQDRNPDTDPDPNWRPLGRPRGPVPNTTPPFPAYTSGHSSFGTAAFGVLRKAYGSDGIGFTLTSDELRGVTRSYASFTQAIDENGRSRIYLGVHWNFDDTRGRTLGQQIADRIWPEFLRPVAR